MWQQLGEAYKIDWWLRLPAHILQNRHVHLLLNLKKSVTSVEWSKPQTKRRHGKALILNPTTMPSCVAALHGLCIFKHLDQTQHAIPLLLSHRTMLWSKTSSFVIKTGLDWANNFPFPECSRILICSVCLSCVQARAVDFPTSVSNCPWFCRKRTPLESQAFNSTMCL